MGCEVTNLYVVVGAQYGSEAKGHVTAQAVREWAQDGATVLNVRVAGPNAGHTVIYDTGSPETIRDGSGGVIREIDGKVPVALRQIPVGAYVDGGVALWIAPGSEVDPDVLATELQQARALGVSLVGRLFISPQATLLEEVHRTREQASGLTVDSGNSTGKGIGAARADRAMRRATLVGESDTVRDLVQAFGGIVADPPWRQFDTVIIEGTQGYGLGLHAGHYPKCTSSDCRAIDFLAMTGISPWDPAITRFTVLAVARAYPIRIAGDSGPMMAETTWADLGLPQELTTVTKRIRRVGLWDMSLVKAAIRANGGGNGSPVVALVITMADQMFEWTAGLTGPALVRADTTHNRNLSAWLHNIEQGVGAPIIGVTTGPDAITWHSGWEAGALQEMQEAGA